MTEIESHTNPIIHAAAFAVNETEAARLCRETQELLDKGQLFEDDLSARMFETENAFSENGFDKHAAAIQMINTQLAGIAIERAVQRMTREECEALTQTLDRIDLGARITLLGQERQTAEIRWLWNKHHPSERPVYPAAGITPET